MVAATDMVGSVAACASKVLAVSEGLEESQEEVRKI